MATTSSPGAAPPGLSVSPHSAGARGSLAPLAERALWVGSRLAWALFILLAISLVAFAGLEMARGVSPLPAFNRGLAHAWEWWASALQGDFGRTTAASSGARPVPVIEVWGGILGRSLGILSAALLLSLLIGVPLGLVAARQRHSNFVIITLVLSILGASLPSFFIALLLQLAVIAYVRNTGQPAPLPVGGFGWDSHLILPALVLATRPIAQVARVTYLSLIETLDQDYIRTARAKGLRETSVWLGHAARNAAIPILTTLATSLRFALSTLPVVELFFGWPGIGFNLLRAIGFRDDNLAVPLLLSLGALFIGINWFVDFAYGRLDPRLRDQGVGHLVGAGGLRQGLIGILIDLRDALLALPLLRRSRSQQQGRDDAFREAIQERVDAAGVYRVDEAKRRRERLLAWRRGTLLNPPFLIGLFIILTLLVVILAGPRLWPVNPYQTQGLTFEGGEFSVPPFPPSPAHWWGSDALGRDIFSLVLAGAKQTLSIAASVVVIRILLGFVLGALAGWQANSRLDRLIMGSAELISAFPALILAMLLIAALGIRNGPWVFVAALAALGWGEVTQYVRAQTITIRPQPYIESAISVGLRLPQLIIRHVLPNLFSALLALSALEMGAALLLLAELGFVGIFIGGGAFADLEAGMTEVGSYHYSDVPEWGSLLANIRLYARAYPWTAIYPSLAFVFAILGFNLLGEGIRRLIAAVSVQFGRIFNRYTALAVLLLLLMGNWVSAQTGPIALYTRQAAAFDGERAREQLLRLAGPGTQGRRLGTAEADVVADHIAAEFKELGLQAGGEELSYFQTQERSYAVLARVPEVRYYNGDLLAAELAYQQDFAPFWLPDFNAGHIRAPVTALLFGNLQQRFHNWPGGAVGYYAVMEDQDFGDEIVLLLDPDDLRYLDRVPRRGLLVVAPPDTQLERYAILAGSEAPIDLAGVGTFVDVGVPSLWITEAAADMLLAGAGASVASLRNTAAQLPEDAIAKFPTGLEAEIDMPVEDHRGEAERNVIGHLPGIDAVLDRQLIMVLAQYDGLGVGPEGTVYPGASDNAAAIAIMLEMLRSWREVGYQPDRTFLFVAYAGEGFETSQGPYAPFNPERFTKAKYTFAASDAFEIEAVVLLRGLGAGEDPVLELASGGNLRLVNLFDDAASHNHLPRRRLREAVDLRAALGTRSGMAGAPADDVAPNITLSLAGWEQISGLPSDTTAAITAQGLEKLGRSLSTALMVLGQERDY